MFQLPAQANCAEHFDKNGNHANGMYYIRPGGELGMPFTVYCDKMEDPTTKDAVQSVVPHDFMQATQVPAGEKFFRSVC